MITYLLLGGCLLLSLFILIKLFLPDASRQQMSTELALLRQQNQELKQDLLGWKADLLSQYGASRREANELAGQHLQAMQTALEKLGRDQEKGMKFLFTETTNMRNDMIRHAEASKNVLHQTVMQGQQQLNDLLKLMGDAQKNQLTGMQQQQDKLLASTEQRLEAMRQTVDEKLQKTLDERLRLSFETVGKHLETVQKGIGEMQSLATDVGGLKKVLSNVKLRGGMGEVQLAMLLEQTLAPNQYAANVRTRPGATELVEFAIKLPNRGEDEASHTWLPVDAKFPKDVYETLVLAYENGDADAIAAAGNLMEAAILKMGKDICGKYIEPPYTTDFAIMFLPFEGIYAEVARRAHVIDKLRSDCKVIIAGPTTLMALLNSLQMGFRTLAIQKRSGEVWKVLGEVKTEFGKYGEMLAKAKDNFQRGMNSLDEVMGKRSRAIDRKLASVESAELPASTGLGPTEGDDEQ